MALCLAKGHNQDMVSAENWLDFVGTWSLGHLGCNLWEVLEIVALGGRLDLLVVLLT